MIEFEIMQKVWSEQKGEAMYVINEEALHDIVVRKKDAASRRINRIEIFVGSINAVLSIILFVIAIRGHPLIFSSFGIMAASVLYILYFRWKRKKAKNIFDRSVLGELEHAISNTNYLISFNYFILVNAIAFALISMIQMIIRRDSVLEWFIITSAIMLSYFIVQREQKLFNLPRKEQLLALKQKLMEQ